MGKIFISYRREDSMADAHQIYGWLAKRFGSGGIFMDVDSIPPGSDFRAAIERAVIDSSIVFVVIGPQWLTVADAAGQRRLENANDFVRIEIEMALRHNIPMIPLLVAGSAMPAPQQLPQTLLPLSYRNAVVVSGGASFEGDLERVAKAVELYAPSASVGQTVSVSQHASAAASPAAHQQKAPGQGISRPWLLGLAITSLVLPITGAIAGLIEHNREMVMVIPDHGGIAFFRGFYTIGVIGVVIGWIAAIRAVRRASGQMRSDWAAGIFFASLLLTPICLTGLPALVYCWRGPWGQGAGGKTA